MPVNEASEILALTLIFVVHVVGGLMLVWGMLDSESRPGWDPRWWRRDDGPDGDPPAPRPSPPPRRAPLPLPGAAPSDVRLRGEERLRDAYPRPPRRPQREPLPEREPQRH
ncbi:MAG TPA: hypothetical protein VGO80_11390 [Solirubrobacteraceae bacterium]|nr:hypothetical protein [Solirubrobacteraceae bacterium]